MSAPLRQSDPCAKWADVERIWRPQGYLAPKGSVAFNNYQAACIAAREVRGKAVHSEAHRRSLKAWEAGRKAWPWPDNEQAADDAVRALLPGLLTDEELLTISKAHRVFERQERARETMRLNDLLIERVCNDIAGGKRD